jgi:arabinofuranosyltransferase
MAWRRVTMTTLLKSDAVSAPTFSQSRWVLTLCLLILACSFFRTAWVCDDAFISFRVIRNAIEGYGLVWNVGERVQVYTHPLWVLMLIPATVVLQEPYFASIALSAACLAGVAWCVVRMAPSLVVAGVAVAILATSRVFMDYSSSGLENPLTHALLAVLALTVRQAMHLGKFTPNLAQVAALIASLLLVNRLDTVLIAAPMVIYVLWRTMQAGKRRSVARVIAIAVLPAMAWVGFAIYYYGSPFPNTYFAKLATGIPSHELRVQGLRYLWASFRFDEPSVSTIALGLALAPFRVFGRVLGSGLILHLLYVVSIGGDFMAGRFLSAPFLISILVILDFVWARSRKMRLVAMCLSAAFLVNVPTTVASSSEYRNFVISSDGIADERGYYNIVNGLQRNIGAREREHPMFAETWIDAMRSEASVYETCYVGMVGYYAPKLYRIVDGYGLTDPFLARLPTLRPWRIGHFERPSPPGYLDRLAGSAEPLDDPKLQSLLTDIDLAHRAELSAQGRLGAIWRLNTGDWRADVERSEFIRKITQRQKPTMYYCRGVAGPVIRPVKRRG